MGVFANGRQILHKGAGNTHVAAPPDVCKTPGPSGAMPIPYPNIAKDGDLADGSKKTKIEGNPAALSSSKLKSSMGDEAGTAGGGLVSSKTRGAMKWASSSLDVKIENKGVARFMDATLQNGNTFNTAFISVGGLGPAYGDDAQCRICNKPPDDHRVHMRSAAEGAMNEIFTELDRRLAPALPCIREYVDLRAEIALLDAEIDSLPEKIQLELQRTTLKAWDNNLRLARKANRDKSLVDWLAQRRQAQSRVVADLEDAFRVRYDPLQARRVNRQNRQKELKPLIAESSPLRADKAWGNAMIQGYMVGVAICNCAAAGKTPKRIAAHSGPKCDRFREAAADLGVTVVDSFQMTEGQRVALEGLGKDSWQCAAPRVIQECMSGGHKVHTMCERWYTPVHPQVVHARLVFNDIDIPLYPFEHGEILASCDECQVLLPEMLCDNEGQCA
jgi:hypothetical protein